MHVVAPFVVGEQFTGPRLAVGLIEIELGNADDRGQLLKFGENQKTIQHATMGLRVVRRENEQNLVGVGDDHLFHIAGVPRQAGERPRARFDALDHTLSLTDIRDPHPITNRNDVGTLALALERTPYRRDQGDIGIVEGDLVPESMGPDDPSGNRGRRDGGEIALLGRGRV
jgi:hypothetical protein